MKDCMGVGCRREGGGTGQRGDGARRLTRLTFILSLAQQHPTNKKVELPDPQCADSIRSAFAVIHLPLFSHRESTRSPSPRLQCVVTPISGAQDDILPEVLQGLQDGCAETGREQTPKQRTSSGKKTSTGTRRRWKQDTLVQKKQEG